MPEVSPRVAEPRATALREQREQMIGYLLLKVKANDFHRVADAAMEIREIDAKLELLAELPRA